MGSEATKGLQNRSKNRDARLLAMQERRRMLDGGVMAREARITEAMADCEEALDEREEILAEAAAVAAKFAERATAAEAKAGAAINRLFDEKLARVEVSKMVAQKEPEVRRLRELASAVTN